MTKQEARLDALYHAMSDPTRRAVVEQLVVAGPASVSELAGRHPIALPTFLKHMRVLEQSGLIHTEKRGRIRMCQVRPAALGQAEDWFRRQRLRMERKFDRLAELAQELERKKP